MIEFQLLHCFQIAAQMTFTPHAHKRESVISNMIVSYIVQKVFEMNT